MRLMDAVNQIIATFDYICRKKEAFWKESVEAFDRNLFFMMVCLALPETIWETNTDIFKQIKNILESRFVLLTDDNKLKIVSYDSFNRQGSIDEIYIYIFLRIHYMYLETEDEKNRITRDLLAYPFYGLLMDVCMQNRGRVRAFFLSYCDKNLYNFIKAELRNGKEFSEIKDVSIKQYANVDCISLARLKKLQIKGYQGMLEYEGGWRDVGADEK